MSDKQMIYNVPETLLLPELNEWISGNGSLVEDPAEEIERAYLDTFDWRLFHAGTVLEVSVDNPGYRLHWRTLQSGEILAQASLRKIPHVATDIVAPRLRNQLREILGARALMKQVTIDSGTRCLRILDHDDKTIMRIEVRKDKILIPNSTKHYVLPPTAYLFPTGATLRNSGVPSRR